MKNICVYGSVFLICLIFSVGCTNNSSNENQVAAADSQSTALTQDTTPVSEIGRYLFSYTIGNLPAPVTVLEQFANAGFTVDPDLLNPYKNVSDYQTAVSKAFNFGIYGIDLAYLVVNNRSMDVINYYSSCKKLAQELNMAESFDQFAQRFENNRDNKDSLMRLYNDAYSSTDNYLRTNDRLETASQILAGSWLESQYITVNLLKNAERNAANENLFQKVWEQKFHLDNISKVFNELKGSEESHKVKDDLDRLLSVYKELKDAKSVDKAFIERLASSLNSVRKNITK